MANLQQESELRDLATIIQITLDGMYKTEMSFLIAIQPFGEGDKVSDYVGNMARESGIEVLRELADRLEKGQVIPASKGQA